MFDSVAELYERVRPSYPDEAVDWLADRLGIDERSTVLDLGAGTGKLTRAFVGRAGRVIAVEPGPKMLAQLRGAVPEAEAILGAAEEIPLPDQSVDAVVCGQSFHWFRTDEALREIRRVLRAGGGLGLAWNVRDPDDPVQKEVTAMLEPFVPAGRPPVTDSVAVVGAAEHASFPFEQELDAEDVADRMLSISFVAAADSSRQDAFADDVRALVARHGGRIAFRYRCEAYAMIPVPST